MAVPLGLIAVCITLVLAWWTLPMIPAVVSWTSETVRKVSDPFAEPSVEPHTPLRDVLLTQEPVDCREAYPIDEWRHLVWHPQTLLHQSYAAPVGAAALAQETEHTIRVTCVFQLHDDSLAADTFATVAEPEAMIATLASSGFTCTGTDLVTCERRTTDLLESHSFGGGVWVASWREGMPLVDEDGVTLDPIAPLITFVWG